MDQCNLGCALPIGKKIFAPFYPTSSKQGRKTLTEFKDELPGLSERLTQAMIQKDATIDGPTTEKCCKAWALDTFQANCHEEVADIIHAA